LNTLLAAGYLAAVSSSATTSRNYPLTLCLFSDGELPNGFEYPVHMLTDITISEGVTSVPTKIGVLTKDNPSMFIAAEGEFTVTRPDLRSWSNVLTAGFGTTWTTAGGWSYTDTVLSVVDGDGDHASVPLPFTLYYGTRCVFTYTVVSNDGLDNLYLWGGEGGVELDTSVGTHTVEFVLSEDRTTFDIVSTDSSGTGSFSDLTLLAFASPVLVGVGYSGGD